MKIAVVGVTLLVGVAVFSGCSTESGHGSAHEELHTVRLRVDGFKKSKSGAT